LLGRAKNGSRQVDDAGDLYLLNTGHLECFDTGGLQPALLGPLPTPLAVGSAPMLMDPPSVDHASAPMDALTALYATFALVNLKPTILHLRSTFLSHLPALRSLIIILPTHVHGVRWGCHSATRVLLLHRRPTLHLGEDMAAAL
jgi:hypothetical protein